MKQFISKQQFETLYTLDSSLYQKFDVKRGLRNQDGSGVLAGLTKISSVVGKSLIDETLVECDGILKYRGISIDNLVKKYDGLGAMYERCLFLLLTGKHLSQEEEKPFFNLVFEQSHLPSVIQETLINTLYQKNIMNMCQAFIACMAKQSEGKDVQDIFENFSQALSLIAALPSFIAKSYLMAYKNIKSDLDNVAGLSLAENFLRLICQKENCLPVEVSTFDLCLALHAEHGGGNNSSFTSHVVSSSGANIYASLAAAVGALSGPLHGAANQKVMEMMDYIKQFLSNWKDEGELKKVLRAIVNKQAHDRSGKIYGLGHAVYTLSDPRAILLKKKAKELAIEKDRLDEFELYCSIEKCAPDVFYEIKGSNKVIAPNVDFYSGFVYSCLGIPKDVYTPIFAMARMAGWCAHRFEEIYSGKRVIRPGYKFVG